jgi:hypothetical protein
MAFDQGYALVIGVGQYAKAPKANVPIAAGDATAVAEALKDPRTCGYRAERVRLLVDAAATRSGTLAALDALAHSTSAGDTVFLFYCGHGAMGDDGNYYFVSHDAQISNKRVVAGTGVSEAELIEKLRALQAKRVLVALNTCYSGQVSPSLSLEGEEDALDISETPQNTTSALLATGSGRIIITAAGEDQRSWIGKGARSYFTQALIDGLNGRGTANKAGFVSAYNLYEYIFETVTETVEDKLGVKQEPELTVLKGVGPFAVSLYRGATNLGDFGEDEPAPDLPGVRQVKPEKAERLMNQFIMNVDNRRIDTGGGAYIQGGVNVQGGDFVGRDQIKTGDINNSSGVAIGRGARVNVKKKDES